MKNALLKLSFLSIAILMLIEVKSYAQNTTYLQKPWKEVATQMPTDWYGSAESIMTADSILKYQTAIGGWTKNTNFQNGSMNQVEWQKVIETGIGATFDNDATITEMRFLIKMYTATQKQEYKNAFEKGLNYVFISQYEKGGWPQFYPANTENGGYSRHITYNDNAMINILEFLDEIVSGSSGFGSLNISSLNKIRTRTAIDKGLSCIINTQITKNAKRTVWCAQHDEITLLPASARTYELPSFSGSESAGIVLYLLRLKNPSLEIKAAVKGAVEWFETHKIEGIRMDTEITKEGKRNRIVVEDKNAPAIWARFYDLETEKPFFCDRDGIKKSSLAEIGYERRNGYS